MQIILSKQKNGNPFIIFRKNGKVFKVVNFFSAEQLFSTEPPPLHYYVYAPEEIAGMNFNWKHLSSEPKTGWKRASRADYMEKYRAEIFKFFSHGELLKINKLLTNL